MQQKLPSTQRSCKPSRKHTLSWMHLYTCSVSNMEKIHETQRRTREGKYI